MLCLYANLFIIVFFTHVVFFFWFFFIFSVVWYGLFGTIFLYFFFSFLFSAFTSSCGGRGTDGRELWHTSVSLHSFSLLFIQNGSACCSRSAYAFTHWLFAKIPEGLDFQSPARQERLQRLL